MKHFKHRPYRGPLMVVTIPEAARVLALLDWSVLPDQEPGDAILRAKCAAALAADPSWRRPLSNP